MKINMGGKELLLKVLLITIVLTSFVLNEPGFSETRAKGHQSGKVEKICLITTDKQDTLTLYYGKDYSSQFSKVDSALSFSISDHKKVKKISKLRLLEIDFFIDNVKYKAAPQSLYAQSTPLSEYFFMTTNSLGYLVFFEQQTFYLDKKESFFKKSFVERVIVPLSHTH